MLPIVDVPFLEHQVAHLRRHGVEDITFACGFLPQDIVAYFGDGVRVGVRLHFVVEPEPLDTGGAIGFAARTVQTDDPVLVCNGDILTELDVGELVRFHRSNAAAATIALTPVDDPSRYGLVRTAGDGSVTAFVEKPSADEIDTNLINAGTYVLERRALELIPREGRCNVEREVFPQLVGDGLYGFAGGGYWNDIGTVPSYLAANVDMLRARVTGAGLFDGSRGEGAIVVDDSATVSAGAQLHGPLYVGPDVVVGDGATVGPDTVLSAGATVSEGARVVRSVVLERAEVQGGANVAQSILGEDSVVSSRASIIDGAVVAPGENVERPVTRG